MNIKKYAVLTLLTFVTSGFAENFPTYQGDCTKQNSSITKYQIDELSAEHPDMKSFHDEGSSLLMHITRAENDQSRSTARVDLATKTFVKDANEKRSQLTNQDQKTQMDAVVCPIIALHAKMHPKS